METCTEPVESIPHCTEIHDNLFEGRSDFHRIQTIGCPGKCLILIEPIQTLHVVLGNFNIKDL